MPFGESTGHANHLGSILSSLEAVGNIAETCLRVSTVHSTEPKIPGGGPVANRNSSSQIIKLVVADSVFNTGQVAFFMVLRHRLYVPGLSHGLNW